MSKKKWLLVLALCACVLLCWYLADHIWPDPVVKTAWYAKHRAMLAEDSESRLLFPGTTAIFTATSLEDVVLPEEDGVMENWPVSGVRTLACQSARPERSPWVGYDKRDFEGGRLPRKGERWAIVAVQSKGATWTLSSAIPLDGLPPESPGPLGDAAVGEVAALSAEEAVRLQEETARRVDLPKQATFSLKGEIALQCVLVPNGSFMMGSYRSGLHDERPAHKVKLSKPFYLGSHEVTQEQYACLTGKNPSKFPGPKRPVDSVTWDEAVEFCRLASEATGRTVRLPTEAEWEHACRAGSVDDPHEVKWSALSPTPPQPTTQAMRSGAKPSDGTAPVGSYPPNAWGLHDMQGNVAEWCSDWYWREYYCFSPPLDPPGPPRGRFRSIRGGGWSDYALCSSSARAFAIFRGYDRAKIGFRVVVEIP